MHSKLLAICVVSMACFSAGTAFGITEDTGGTISEISPYDIPEQTYLYGESKLADTSEPPPGPPGPPGPSCEPTTLTCGVTVAQTVFEMQDSTFWVDKESSTIHLGPLHVFGGTSFYGPDASTAWRVGPAPVTNVGGLLIDASTSDVFRIPEKLPKTQFYKLIVPPDNRRIRATFERTCKGVCNFDAFVLDPNGNALFKLPKGIQTHAQVTVQWDSMNQEFFLLNWRSAETMPVP